MKPRVFQWPLFSSHRFIPRRLPPSHYLRFADLHRSLHAACSSAGSSGNNNGSAQGNYFLVPGATAATIVMLGLLHARRIYQDKKVEDMKEKGIEVEFSPDAKAAFLRLFPLRSMSRCWGFLMSLEVLVLLRPFVYKAWSRAFHSNLDEAALPLENYASLQEFFTRTLKEGSRPVDPDPNCLVSPVDGTVLRFGELRGPRALIGQVKGFAYSASSLLGVSSSLHEVVNEDTQEEYSDQSITDDSSKRSWWRISFASPKVRSSTSMCPSKGVFYCVLYLKPGDYHRVHSPVDWHVCLRRHFSGRLFPLNERATRTIKNLHVENERLHSLTGEIYNIVYEDFSYSRRISEGWSSNACIDKVVLEGRWREGFIAIAAIGATNVGSIKVSTEPEFRTNRPIWRLQSSNPPDEKLYEPEGTGILLKKGDEVAVFNMGSTVVLVFQAPVSRSQEKDGLFSEFKFCIQNGDRIRVGEAIGRWGKS